MGILTSDMKRLRQEIRVLRGTRKVLLHDLARGTKEMKDVVAGMRAGFRNAHTEMARNTKAEREAFVSALKRNVSGMRKEFADDLAGARQAWLGLAPARRMTVDLEGWRRAEIEVERGMEEIEAHAVEEKIEAQAVEAAEEEIEAQAVEAAEEEIEAQAVEAAEEEIEAQAVEEEIEHAEAGIREEEKVKKVTPPVKPKPKGKKKK